ncbi:hypothetical protein ERJ75_001054100 [Trypanosoma vivax]|nr:hypothetical protein ERJ75_001054100 [Trypanosoma vivax]
MTLFLRCAFVLVLLGATALGDAHAGEGEGSEVGEGASGASEAEALIRPRSLFLGGGGAGGRGKNSLGKRGNEEGKLRLWPRGPPGMVSGNNCSNTNGTACESCVEGAGACLGGPLSLSSLPGAGLAAESASDPLKEVAEAKEEEEEGEEEEEEEEAVEGSKSKSEEDKSPSPNPERPPAPPPSVESKESEQSDQHGNQNGNQREQSNGNTGHSQLQVNQPTSGDQKDPEEHETKPVAPGGSSSGPKDAAKGEKEAKTSTDQKHDSVTNGESVKGVASESEVINDAAEKHEGPGGARGEADGQGGSSGSDEGQHSASATAEASGAPFRERSSVVPLLAILSRFCACKC